jgi:F-type H+-transporting ATPase subunit a
MAEHQTTAPEQPDSEAADAGEAHASGAGDPMHHIKDQVLAGLSESGGVVWKPYNEHGQAVVGYAPRTFGPVKAEFTKHMLGTAVIAALLFAMVTMVVRRIVANLRADRAPRGALANTVEAVVVFVRDELVVPLGGRHVAGYTPLFLTYFFFVLLCNLLGMVPMAGGVTGNIGVTAALGGSVWFVIMLLGMVHQGPVGFFLHMVPKGTPWLMWPLMFVLELMGPIIKCFVLCVRLFANMIAGHLVVSNVLSLAAFGSGLMPAAITGLLLVFGVPLALGISLLEILVCFIQAYVFTLLSVIFIGAAVHPEH